MLLLALLQAGAASVSPPLPPVGFNDNRVSAGTLRNGVLQLTLEARRGEWHPLGADQEGIAIFALAETGKPLETPGPLLRVPLGTRIRARVHNATAKPLVLHGFSAHRVELMDTLVVAAGATGQAEWTADAEGTWYYWGSTSGSRMEERNPEDRLLTGAYIVDPAGSQDPPRDRIFVIQDWAAPDPQGEPDIWTSFMTFNGRPWPFTERLVYEVGDSVRWRFINAVNEVHPLHLHGFYYRVDARGDFQQDTLYWPGQRRMAVTEFMDVGTTLDLAWSPDRPGGWIFHCHYNFHVLPNPGLGAEREPVPVRIAHVFNGYPMHHPENHAEEGMGGLVLGIEVKTPPGWHSVEVPRRRLRLLVRSDSLASENSRRFGYALIEGDGSALTDSVRYPGPPIVLHRGEPSSVWVVNQSPEATQVHWHGLELESYFDGVAGLSGMGAARAPMIEPGDSFEMRVTPPRAGSFMYHTHINDIRQQGLGLYGPLLVLEPGATWDPATDHVFIAGDTPNDRNTGYVVALNGGTAPPPLELRAGVPQRLRLMSITVIHPGIRFALIRNGTPVEWTALAKDGQELPAWQQRDRRAELGVSMGETYDFGISFPAAGEYAMEVRSSAGRLFARQVIRVVK